MHHNMNFMIIIALTLITIYIIFVLQNKQWPIYRTFFWCLGIILASSVIIFPIFHHQFDMHMYGHLILGMAAPLLMALSKPITLLLNSLNVHHARKVTKLLKSGYIKLITHPLSALILNTGGLWLLYRSSLFMMMHESLVVFYLVHFHVFAAGYLFTSVILQNEPTAHPYTFKYRSIVMIISVALHQILSKSFYPYPPAGVEKVEAENGAIIMYYGGDVIELIVIFLMCYQWYYSTRPNKKIDMNVNQNY